MLFDEDGSRAMFRTNLPRALPWLLTAAILAASACQSPPRATLGALTGEGILHSTATPAGEATRPTVAAVPTVIPTPTSLLPPSPTPTASPASGRRNVALTGSVQVSAGEGSAEEAVDGDPESLWTAGAPPPQTYLVTLDGAYLVDSIELVVAQMPAGQTTHEIWLGGPSGELTLYRKLVNVWTADGDTLSVPVTPPRLVSRVLIRTDTSPSFVAWREVRVFGQPSAGGAPTANGTPQPAAEVDWPKLSIHGHLDQPVQVTNAGDGSGRIFVVERRGRIRIVRGDGAIDQPFLDISDRVKCCEGEQGLLGLAFPPDFKRKQYFYVSYTSQPRDGRFGPVGDVVVARYHVTANPNLADSRNEEVILVVPKPANVHNGGHLAFGPKDGYLYVGIGDGGLPNDPTNEAQNPNSLLGKILRIDPESGTKPYAIPPTNPFVHTTGARPEVWALGLRNPWVFSFDRQTGDLYIADVGENDYEEVDVQPAASHGGENYGWHVMEGAHCHLPADCSPLGFTFPVVEYKHDQGCAIVGGAVYRGTAFPSMQGIYFYGDLCSGRIWGLKRVGEVWESNLLAREPFSITSIGEDEAGNLYLTDFTDGTILEITAAPPEPH